MLTVIYSAKSTIIKPQTETNKSASENNFSQQVTCVSNNAEAYLKLRLFNDEDIPLLISDRIKEYLSDRDMLCLAQTCKNNRAYVYANNNVINLARQISSFRESIKNIFCSQYSNTILFRNNDDQAIAENYVHAYVRLSDADKNQKAIINPLILAIENARDDNVRKIVPFLLKENHSLVKKLTAFDYQRLEKHFNHLCSDVEKMRYYHDGSVWSSPTLRQGIEKLRDFLAIINDLSNHDRSHFNREMEERMNRRGYPLLQYN